MKCILEGFKNLVVIVSSSYKFDSLLELESFKSFFFDLNKLLDFNSNYHFHVFWGMKNEENVLLDQVEIISNKLNVLFWIGDEEGYIPSDYVFKRFKYVFKVHLRDRDAIKIENGINVYRDGLFHFPLLTIDEVPELPILPLAKRKHNLYYCGNLNKNRLPFYLVLNRKAKLYEYLIAFLLKYNLRGGDRLFNVCYNGKSFDLSNFYSNSYIKFYSGFNNGDDYKTYAKFLQNSKIVLSPTGFYSTECFRFYEAMRQGCIVITEGLPNVECYKGAPCIRLKNWKTLSSVLSDKELIDSFSSDYIKDFYNKKLSPNAIAKYVNDILIRNI